MKWLGTLKNPYFPLPPVLMNLFALLDMCRFSFQDILGSGHPGRSLAASRSLPNESDA